MDLHDYKDVAENYDLYLDAMCTQEAHKYDGFLDFYLGLAKKYGGGGVIDVACGTGAVLLHLVGHGIMADGTDISAEMCGIARQKAQSKGYNPNIFTANMTDFDAGRQYSLAIIARSGFMHLPDQKSQRAALENLRKNLLSGGILTLNTFDPWPPAQTEQLATSAEDYTFRVEYTNSEGRREKIFNAISYNPFTQQMRGSWKFVTYDDDGRVIGERVRPLLMRQTYRSEMFLLAELCGFKIIDIFRGYKGDKEDLSDPASAWKFRSNLIWILQKAD